MGNAVKDHRELGASVIERLDHVTVPASARPYVRVFRAAHAGLDRASREVDTTRDARDRALRAIHDLDALLDTAIDRLADRIVGEGLGPRSGPFGKWMKISPTGLKDLGYANEVKQTRVLVAKITRATSATPIVRELKGITQLTERVEKALRALSAPQAAYAKALAKRDALLPDWERAFRRLRVQLQAAWIDEPETFASVFAEPEAVQRPVTRRAKKKTDKPAPTATPA